MSNLIQFLNGAVGRLLRVALGVALIWYGLLVLGGTAGAILAVVGLVPIGLGLWGHCLLELVATETAHTA
jgi:Inner membrane protein YgaP-like, transmembrane domain